MHHKSPSVEQGTKKSNEMKTIEQEPQKSDGLKIIEQVLQKNETPKTIEQAPQINDEPKTLHHADAWEYVKHDWPGETELINSLPFPFACRSKSQPDLIFPVC